MESKKQQLATQALFYLIHNNGDTLREGWKNVIEFLLYLLRANLLPSKLCELEDSISIKEMFKRAPIIPKKQENFFTFSWFINNENKNNETKMEEEQVLSKAASIISSSHPEKLIEDSKYLTTPSFIELINSIIQCSIAIAPIQQKTPLSDSTYINQYANQQNYESQGSQSQDDDSIVDEEALIFLLELMLNIVLENCDRLAQVWPLVRDHLLLTINSQNKQIAERSIISLIRIANRNIFRLGHPQHQQSQQILNGLQQLLKSNAANIQSSEHLAMFFSLLDAVGAAVYQDDNFDLVDIVHPISSSPLQPLLQQNDKIN